jgi:hypothetical protein
VPVQETSLPPELWTRNTHPQSVVPAACVADAGGRLVATDS